MNNIFTKYLESTGWLEKTPCSYKKQNLDIEIFFDTSNQIEIYTNEQHRIGSHYLKDLEDLIKIVNNAMTLGNE